MGRGLHGSYSTDGEGRQPEMVEVAWQVFFRPTPDGSRFVFTHRDEEPSS